MDEYVDILDDNGNYTGKALLKSEAHAKGLFHPTVHVWLYTTNGEILLQKRSANKDIFPGCWDVSVAGHIGAGETPLNSAIRETGEELGLEIPENALEKIGVYKSVKRLREDLTDCEFNHIYISRLNTPLNRLKLQQTEVDDVRLMNIDEFLSDIRRPYPSCSYVLLSRDYYTLVFGTLKKRLKQTGERSKL